MRDSNFGSDRSFSIMAGISLNRPSIMISVNKLSVIRNSYFIEGVTCNPLADHTENFVAAVVVDDRVPVEINNAIRRRGMIPNSSLSWISARRQSAGSVGPEKSIFAQKLSPSP